jgi:predicted nucleic acid-binding Zn ribbon protein
MVTDRQLAQIAENRYRRRDVQPLAETVLQIRQRFSGKTNQKLRALQDQWSQLLEPEIAELSFPSGLREGTLIVSVATPAAKFAIEQVYRAVLLEQFASISGKSVRTIKCVLEDLPRE